MTRTKAHVRSSWITVGLTALSGWAALSCVPAYGLDVHSTLWPTSRTCVSNEKWNLGSLSDEYQSEFKSFLDDSTNPEKALRGFSEAVSLRRFAKTAEEKTFSEYWISRALFGLGLPHLASMGFESIAAREPSTQAVAIHAAALDCLLKIHESHPSIQLPEVALTYLGMELGAQGDDKASTTVRTVGLDVAVAGVQKLLSDDRVDPQRIQSLLAQMKNGGPYEELAQGIWAAKQSRYKDTLKYLAQYFSDSIPSSLIRYKDTAHLLSARAKYSLGDFDAAGNELKLVQKRSNDLAAALEELSWADLMNERYPEAIGTAINLDGGGLRHTYAPEAPMVSSMAMNELCQYPDAVKEIAIFRRDYKQSYSWLSNWVNTESDKPEAVQKLYEEAVHFIGHKPDSKDLPERVAGEWVRTPLFIASQDEVNAYFDEKDFLAKVGGVAAREQRAMALQILKNARELKPKYQVARMKLKAGDTLPSSIIKSLASLKKEVVHWHRFQRAAPVWMNIANRFRSTIAPAQTHLLARINSSIKDMNLRMYSQLDEISENIQLVEVEIYNGASQDIIWQNAHPDYRQLAKEMKDQRESVARSKVWDWGREPGSSEEGGEIWEDELGSFKANLFDNCSSKDKYLALRARHRASR